MQVLIINDPIEAGRQVHADGGEFLHAVVEEVTRSRPDLHIRRLSEQDLDTALGTLSVDQVVAVVFGSNALRHPDSRIAHAVAQHRQRLADFVEAGGGILVLHQFLFRTVLDLGLTEVAFRRRSAGAVYPLQSVGASSVLQVPHVIGADSRPATVATSQLGRQVHWLAVDEDRLVNCDVVLRSATGEALVARSAPAIAGRLAICAVPVDWHQWGELAENLLRFVIIGDPDVIVWSASDAGVLEDPVAQQALANGGLFWPPEHQDRVPMLSPPPQLHVVARDTPGLNLDVALQQGATVLEVSGLADGRCSQYQARVGPVGVDIARRAMAALRASDFTAAAPRDPYPLRNVVLASEYFSTRFAVPGAWRPTTDLDFAAATAEYAIFDAMTVTSALASLQVQHLLAPGGAQTRRLTALITTLIEGDQSPSMAGYRAAAHTLEHGGSIDEWLDTMGDLGTASSAELARWLDWIGYFQITGHRPDPSGPLHRVGGELLAAVRTAARTLEHTSVEARANILLGLCALQEWGVEGPRVLINAIRPQLRSWLTLARSTSAAEVSIYLRVAHAVARAEDVSPAGVDAMAQALASLTGPASVTRPVPAEGAVGATLAERNKRLRDELVAREGQIAQMRRGLRVGMLASWLIVLAVVITVLVLVLRTLPGSDLSDLLVPALLLCALIFAGGIIGLDRVGLVPGALRWSVGWFGRLWRRFSPFSSE